MPRLRNDSLDWALAHALKYGDTDVFPRPFEFEAIEHDWQEIRRYLSQQDIRGWNVRPHRSLIAPKGKYGFRVVTQLDPLDFLVFAATVKEIAEDIESHRVSVLHNIVFSYRYAPDPDGRLFNPDIGYRSFQSHCKTTIDARPQYSHIGVTDISDFYPRIYHHRMENALQSACNSQEHVSSVRRLLSGWNGTETFGIPVGNAPSRLLAEITITDVDEALLARGVNFARFNDDYRLFACSHAEAYRHLAFLADILFRNHGLTLQSQKTEVVTVDRFRQKYLPTAASRELDSLHDRFDELIDRLGLTDSYEEIDYDDLSLDDQQLVDSLNLVELFRDNLAGDGDVDMPLVRFVLRRLAQLGNTTILDDVIDNLDSLHPAFPDIVHYLRRLRGLSDDERRTIGQRVIELIRDSIVSELEYHKMWALSLFAESAEWKNEQEFYNLLLSSQEQTCRRKLILAMGRAAQSFWFQSMWRNLFDEPHWSRRALLAAASCMPSGAHVHWYRSVEPRLDPLEKAIVRWARQHPFTP